VLEELDESEGWFRLLVKSGISTEHATRQRSAEAVELVRIFAASILTAKSKRQMIRWSHIPIDPEISDLKSERL
jgi:hypothetical protein